MSNPDLAASAQEAAAAAARTPRDTGKLIHAANLLLRAGDRVRAVTFARDAVAAEPSSFRAVRTLSGILDATGARAEAIDYGQRAIGLDPANAEARLHLGGLFAAERRWREAAEHLSQHVASAAATPRGWRLLSSVLHQGGEPGRAIEAARNAIAADANAVEYRLHLVSLLSASGLYAAALAELDIALRLAPDNAHIWRTRSTVHAALGDVADALQSAQRAAAIAPDDTACREQLAHIEALCGLPVAGDASSWTIKPRRAAAPARERPPPRFSDQAAMRWRVIYAIILRDIRTRFGHSRMGYIWALIEPISHLCTLGVVFFALNHSPAPVGDSLFLFYITGLVPFLMFSHVSHDVMGATAANAVMLQLPIVKRTDVMVAQALRQLATELCVAIIIFSIAELAGFQAVPVDPMTAMAAIGMLWLLAVGIGAFNLVICEMYPPYDTFYQSLVRLLYFTSGIYYTPIRMPEWVRDYLEWNPILQGVEYFRAGFFNQYDPHWLNPEYLMTWVLASLVIGFSLERALRGRMRVQS